MANFLDRAEILRRSPRLEEDQEHFDRVFSALAELQSIYAKASLDTDNLEAVFVAFEMAQLLGGLGRTPSDELAKLTASMKRVIVRTLEESLLFRQDGTKILPSQGYMRLAEYAKSNMGEVTLITFNYDCGLDYGLACAGVPIDYKLDERSKNHNACPVLKLHGSLMWEQKDDGAVINHRIPTNLSPDSGIVTQRGNNTINVAFTKLNSVDVAYSVFESTIVPPTWDKAKYRDSLKNVWRYAAQALAEAENIVIAGFSLPPADEFFRYLYALGSVGDSRLKRFWVCDKNPTMEMDQRFRNLLGPRALSRYSIVPYEFDSVADSLNHGWETMRDRMRSATINFKRVAAMNSGIFENQPNRNQFIGDLGLGLGLGL